MFKNITIFQVDEPIIANNLRELMKNHPAREIGDHESIIHGWNTLALGELVFDFTGGFAFCLQTLEKVIPSSSLARLVDKKINEIEEAQARKLPKKERSAIKEQVIYEVLPTAMVKESAIKAYFDTEKNWLVIDAAGKKAEDFASFLRKTLGSLPAVPICKNTAAVSLAMTNWAEKINVPASLTVNDSLDLEHCEEGKVKIRNASVDRELSAMISQGFAVSMASISVDGQALFNLTSNLTLKGFSVSDQVIESILGGYEEMDSDLEMIQSDLIIQADVVRKVMDVLLNALGFNDTESA